jgi:hypothetical protein
MAKPVLHVISPEASEEEVAAIVAAISASLRTGVAAFESPASDRSRWVSASRLSARRAGLARAEWRLSGRIGRRARA